MKIPFLQKITPFYSRFKKTTHVAIWFLLGALIGLFFFASFVFMYFRHTYNNKIYPGVSIEKIDLGGKTQEEVKQYYADKNLSLKDKLIYFKLNNQQATSSATELEIGYDYNLLSEQAYSVGRSGNFFTDSYLCFLAYLKGIQLSPSYTYSDKKLNAIIKQFEDSTNENPIDAKFTFKDGKVTDFSTASDGKKVNSTKVHSMIQNLTPKLTKASNSVTIPIEIQTIKPDIENNEANSMGITERIGMGTSLFYGSIPNRIYNLNLASSQLNGVLVKPGEEFSFNKTIGDVSASTGYKQAYVIQSGKTVLGDGGGVCQVSTTLFRALLNAGLPVTERNQHAYRVHYYEDDLGPGVDAAIYTPTVDLQFTNDTNHHILIQTYVDSENMQLVYQLYGTSDGRKASVSKPVIVSQSPAPEPLYQDDPTLPVGQVKQIDFAASGAVVYFDYKVEKNGKIIEKRFNSNYRPWQAVYLRGTKPV